MIRRLAGAVLAACALFALFAAGAEAAEVPAGPRLTFLRAGAFKLQLVSADPAGQDQRVIVGNDNKGQPLPFPYSPPTWSTDGTRVAFTGMSRRKDHALLDIYDAAADGSGIRKLPRSRDGVYPVLSPDGHTLAFARERDWESRRPRRGKVVNFESVSIWLLDLDSGALRQLTPWRNGLFVYPSSFDPDGSTLAVTWEKREDGVGPTVLVSAVALRLDGSGSTVLARNAGEPVYSPEGTRLALVTRGRTRTFKSRNGRTTITSTELAVANADGSGLSRLTHTRALELQPSWDPSGQRLAYTQLNASGGEANFLGFGDSIMEINADGTCQTRILSYPHAVLYGATWQPGPGREAGPISC